LKKIRILIADDHAVVRQGLRALFRSVPDFLVVGEAASGEGVSHLVDELKADVVLVDISMPRVSGIEATHLIKKRNPGTKVLILTMYDNEEYLHQMVRAGANGYVLKNADKKELFAAVRTVADGKRFFSPGISELMIDEFVKHSKESTGSSEVKVMPLTKREIEILRYIAQGLTNKRIAEKIYLSVRTVNTHRNNLMQKLDIHDTAGLVRYAIQSGVIELKS
jgi:NarL family two-component system response regulator LiaR